MARERKAAGALGSVVYDEEVSGLRVRVLVSAITTQTSGAATDTGVSIEVDATNVILYTAGVHRLVNKSTGVGNADINNNDWKIEVTPYLVVT